MKIKENSLKIAGFLKVLLKATLLNSSLLLVIFL